MAIRSKAHICVWRNRPYSHSRFIRREGSRSATNSFVVQHAEGRCLVSSYLDVGCLTTLCATSMCFWFSVWRPCYGLPWRSQGTSNDTMRRRRFGERARAGRVIGCEHHRNWTRNKDDCSSHERGRCSPAMACRREREQEYRMMDTTLRPNAGPNVGPDARPDVTHSRQRPTYQRPPQHVRPCILSYAKR